MRLGVHVSVRRGYAAALDEVRALGCAALQILPYPRHHYPTSEELAAFRGALFDAGVTTLLIHSRFVPSLASSDEVRRTRSVTLLAKELALSEALGGSAYVLHAGAYSPDADLGAGVKLFADSVRRAVEQSGYLAPLLLENVPGGGRRMGGSLEELARLRDALAPRVSGAVGACLDTAHAWAAGYDLSAAEGAIEFLSSAQRLLGVDAVRAFHLNDTRARLGSHREHHEHWGRGRLGSEGLKALLALARFDAVPGIFETPRDGIEADRANLDFVRGLTSAAA